MKRIHLDIQMDDGTALLGVPVHNRALVAYDFERARCGWPTPQDAPMLWQTYLAWSHMCQEGLYSPTVPPGSASSFAMFRDVDCVAVAVVKDHEDEDVNPTRAGSEPASLSPPQAE